MPDSRNSADDAAGNWQSVFRALPRHLRKRDVTRTKRGNIGISILRLHDKERQAFVPLREIPIVSREQSGKAIVADLVRLGERQQLNEEARQLDNMIVSAPWVLVTRADGKTQTAIEIGCGVEIAHCVNNVIQSA
jgi:hypothetical protein